MWDPQIEKDTVVVSSSAVDEPLDDIMDNEDVNVGKAINFRTLFTSRGNGVDVVVPMESIRAISEWFAKMVYGFFLGKRVAYPFSYMDGLDAMLENGPRSSYARAMIEVLAEVKLKDNIVAALPKITREGYYTCNIRVEYEWKPPRCACCKVFGHIWEECPKNPGLDMAKNLKKLSQAPRGVPVRPKVGFKPAKEYRPVAKKPTANTSSIKKKCVEPTKEGVTSSRSLFWNVETSNISTTPIVEKIGKLKQLVIDGKGTLVDDDGKPLKRVDYPGDHDSDDEVCLVDNDMARSMATEMVGFGTQSLLKKCRDSYGNGDYDEC
ncbi:hypothetical protein Tco_1184118 [Tanacetum coccineum]